MCHDKTLNQQCIARSGSPHDDEIILLVITVEGGIHMCACVLCGGGVCVIFYMEGACGMFAYVFYVEDIMCVYTHLHATLQVHRTQVHTTI